MSQLVDKVRKNKANKIQEVCYKRQGCFIETSNFTNDSESNQDFDIEYVREHNIVELKPGPPYIGQMLKHEENKSKFSNAKYTFHVSMVDKIFDILLK